MLGVFYPRSEEETQIYHIIPIQSIRIGHQLASRRPKLMTSAAVAVLGP